MDPVSTPPDESVVQTVQTGPIPNVIMTYTIWKQLFVEKNMTIKKQIVQQFRLTEKITVMTTIQKSFQEVET